jgi:hypothetical protein
VSSFSIDREIAKYFSHYACELESVAGEPSGYRNLWVAWNGIDNKVFIWRVRE